MSNNTSFAKEMKDYWDQNPIGVEQFDELVGSPEFYKKYLEYYDDFYGYKWKTFQYEKYKDKKVLEIGCGLGVDSVKFAKSGADLTCIDLSDTSVQNTKKGLSHLNLKANVAQGNVEELDFPDNTFDVVYAYGVLMYAQNEKKAYEQVYRVLKPGGEALVTLYHSRSWYWLLVTFSGTKVESEKGDPPLNRAHSIKEVRKLFKDYSSVQITLDRFPIKTNRRRGLKSFLFNWIFVPITKIIPTPLMRPFGWHIIVKAVK